MKRRSELWRKEGGVVLLAALFFAAALYRFLATPPVALGEAQPFASLAAPAEIQAGNPAALRSARAYLAGERDPFAKVAAAVVEATPVPDAPISAPPSQENARFAAEHGAQPTEDPAPADTREKLQYLGVVFADGRSCGLLRLKDAAATRRVQPGDAIPEYGCKVTRIGRQGISLVDAEGRAFVLTDGWPGGTGGMQ